MSCWKLCATLTRNLNQATLANADFLWKFLLWCFGTNIRIIITSLHLFPKEHFLYFHFLCFIIICKTCQNTVNSRLSHMCQPCFSIIYHLGSLLLLQNIIILDLIWKRVESTKTIIVSKILLSFAHIDWNMYKACFCSCCHAGY